MAQSLGIQTSIRRLHCNTVKQHKESDRVSTERRDRPPPTSSPSIFAGGTKSSQSIHMGSGCQQIVARSDARSKAPYYMGRCALVPKEHGIARALPRSRQDCVKPRMMLSAPSSASTRRVLPMCMTPDCTYNFEDLPGSIRLYEVPLSSPYKASGNLITLLPPFSHRRSLVAYGSPALEPCSRSVGGRIKQDIPRFAPEPSACKASVAASLDSHVPARTA